MKLRLLLLLLCCPFAATFSQSYLDNYINTAFTVTVIGNSTHGVAAPRDLDFKPHTNELWVLNYGNSNGSSHVIFYNAGTPDQTNQYRKDTHSGHFMVYSTAFAFGDSSEFANLSEIQHTNASIPTFMGPALWSADTAIYARVFQNNWVNGYPLGSHIDMLHQSPFGMGIAHDSLKVYWVLDGYNGNICRYDFVRDHGPGYDEHGAGKIWRYSDVPFSMVGNIPSHAVLDRTSRWLYYIDGGSKQLRRLNTATGTQSGNISVPSTAPEPLSGYFRMLGADVDTLFTFSTQPCGIDFYQNRLVVSDYTNGNLYLFGTDSTVTLLDTLVTNQPGMTGVKIGPDGHIWCVNRTQNSVYRLDVAPPTLDLSVSAIVSPEVQNAFPDFYSRQFNVCSGNVAPVIELTNAGTADVTSVDLEYTIGLATAVPFSWTGLIAASATQNVVLPSSVVLNGSHMFTVRIVAVNGGSDEVSLNNTAQGSFRVVDPPVMLPQTMGFDATTFPPAGWNYVYFNPNNRMFRAPQGGFGLSTGCMKMNNYTGPMNINGQRDYLLTPVLDLSTFSTPSMVRFDVAYARSSASDNDGLLVEASTDCGETWTTLYSKSGATLSTAATIASAFTPTASQWRTDSIDISAYNGAPSLLLSFTSVSGYGNNLYVDNIYIGDLLTGLHGSPSAPVVNVYPNPAGQSLHISMQGVNQDVTGSIFSVDGRLVQSFRIHDGAAMHVLDVSRLANGVYSLQLEGEDFLLTKKISKQAE